MEVEEVNTEAWKAFKAVASFRSHVRSRPARALQTAMGKGKEMKRFCF